MSAPRKETVIAGIGVVILFQILVLAGVYLGAVYPLWTGKEIRLKTVPVDPRSLFRGNYAQLRYDISNIDASILGVETRPRNGETVYIRLKSSPDGIYVMDGAGLEKPAGPAPFIRGRLLALSRGDQQEKYEVRYGIEAWFAPKEKALALEKDLRGGGIARVMVAGNGKAALKDVTGKP